MSIAKSVCMLTHRNRRLLLWLKTNRACAIKCCIQLFQRAYPWVVNVSIRKLGHPRMAYARTQRYSRPIAFLGSQALTDCFVKFYRHDAILAIFC